MATMKFLVAVILAFFLSGVVSVTDKEFNVSISNSLTKKL